MNVIDWCRKNDVWYLQIPLEIPKECISEAQSVYEAGFFVPHRYSDGDGWYSCSLHGFVDKNKQDTSMAWYHTKNPSGYGLDERDVRWGWSEISEIAPETTRWLKEFPHTKYRRCRFMLLKPKGRIESHDDSPPDSPGRRTIAAAINIALTQPEGCYLRRSDTKEELPFKPCTGFWFDNGVEHEAYNGSNENRFHFIIHGGSNQERKKLMLEAIKKKFGNEAVNEIINI